MEQTYVNIYGALDAFLDRVNPVLAADDKHEWYILGSCAALLQDCEIEPADIELTVKNVETARLMEDALKDCITEPLKKIVLLDGVVESWYGCYMVDNVKIEVMAAATHRKRSNWYNESYGNKRWDNVRYLEANGKRVPVIPLEFIIVTNAYRNRKERVFKCGEAMKQQGYDVSLLHTILAQGHVPTENQTWIANALEIQL